MKSILRREFGAGVIRLVQGDITLAQTDAIVNAANEYLQHGGGVAAAIVRRGGRVIQEESDRIGHCAEGQAVVTGGGALAARYVIHAVGPRGGDPQGDEKLASAVVSSLRRAEELSLAGISLPAISSGIFGFPRDRCAQILLDTAGKHLTRHPQSSLRQIDFVLFDDETADVFAREWREMWGE
jgi:O-acetyl-ADP-ribose deacetylase (regulator of RNase III)